MGGTGLVWVCFPVFHSWSGRNCSDQFADQNTAGVSAEGLSFNGLRLHSGAFVAFR